MELRDLSRNSQRSYLNALSGLTKYYMQPPDKVTKQILLETDAWTYQKGADRILNYFSVNCSPLGFFPDLKVFGIGRRDEK